MDTARPLDRLQSGQVWGGAWEEGGREGILQTSPPPPSPAVPADHNAGITGIIIIFRSNYSVTSISLLNKDVPA